MTNFKALKELTLIIVLCFTSSALATENQKMRPADCLHLAAILAAEIKLLQEFMGITNTAPNNFYVEGATPREVYFQAVSLYIKSNRLSYEHTRTDLPLNEEISKSITPTEVCTLIQSSLDRLRTVSQKYSLALPEHQIEIDQNAEPTDVFHEIEKNNQQLNIMLEVSVTPSDVFERLTSSIGYITRVLEQFTDAKLLPDEPPYIANKQPKDVYFKLVDIIRLLEVIYQESGLTMLKLTLNNDQSHTITPNDVNDLAGLIEAETRHLHSLIENIEASPKVFYAGKKFPSHVHQRARILEWQLIELQSNIAKSVNWLLPSSES
jgi:hypothetical protein